MGVPVPVIVIFTKLTAQGDEVLKGQGQGLSANDATVQTPGQAVHDFQNYCKDSPLFKSRFPPKTFVAVQGIFYNCKVSNLNGNI